MTRPDGTYDGKVFQAYLATDSFNEGEYVLKLDCEFADGGTATCRHPLKTEDNAAKERRESLMKELDLPWPFKSSDLAGLKDRAVRIRLKTSDRGQRRQNAYIATNREERVLTPEEVDALASARDDIPF